MARSADEGSGSVAAKLNLYEILGIQEDCDSKAIKEAFRSKALLLHPDKAPKGQTGSAAAFAEVQKAFEVLSQLDSREEYDAGLKRQRSIERVAFELSVDEMEYDEATGRYYKKCRCGEQFQIAEDDLVDAEGRVLIECTGCSLRATVIDG